MQFYWIQKSLLYRKTSKALHKAAILLAVLCLPSCLLKVMWLLISATYKTKLFKLNNEKNFDLVIKMKNKREKSALFANNFCLLAAFLFLSFDFWLLRFVLSAFEFVWVCFVFESLVCLLLRSILMSTFEQRNKSTLIAAFANRVSQTSFASLELRRFCFALRNKSALVLNERLLQSRAKLLLISHRKFALQSKQKAAKANTQKQQVLPSIWFLFFFFGCCSVLCCQLATATATATKNRAN